MPRPPRFLLAGGHYHVLARGNLKQDIFLNDVDRLCWLGLLGEACQRHHWKCLAWVQMNNHYHLIVRTDEPTLSDGMQLLMVSTRDVLILLMIESGMSSRAATRLFPLKISDTSTRSAAT